MTCLQLYVLFYPSFLLLIYYYRYIIITSDHYVNAKKWTFFLFQKNGSSHIILIQLYKIIGIFSFFKNIFFWLKDHMLRREYSRYYWLLFESFSFDWSLKKNYFIRSFFRFISNLTCVHFIIITQGFLIFLHNNPQRV